MKRVEHRDGRGALVAIELRDRDAIDTSSAIEVQSAPPALIRIAVGGRPAIWARVERCGSGWSWVGAPDGERTWPATRAADARGAARRGPGTDGWLAYWIDVWSDAIERATARTRGRVDVVVLREEAPPRYAYLDAPLRWRASRVTNDWPQSWHSAVLPLRAWPAPDDGRVKAYRKLALTRELPPLVVRWVSGLMAYVLVDGHARMVAAELENVSPHALAIVPVYAHTRTDRPRWSERATAAVEALLASRDAKTRFRALEVLNRNALDDVAEEWTAIERARPIPGGARAWRAEVERALGPHGARDHAGELLAPFERPTRFHFTW